MFHVFNILRVIIIVFSFSQLSACLKSPSAASAPASGSSDKKDDDTDDNDSGDGGEEEDPEDEEEVVTNAYSVFVASGFPTATASATISEWSEAGVFLRKVKDYTLSSGFVPMNLDLTTFNGRTQLIAMVGNGTTGRLDVVDFDGTDFESGFIDNTTAMAAGSKRVFVTADGSFLVSRTAGVERFSSAKARVGAPRYGSGGTCAITAVTSVGEAVLSGTSYILSTNSAASPNNKINLYNGATGACIAGVVPAGPATTMWPVALHYVQSLSKLFVLYYPFTGAATNAQIWSFDVTGATINNGSLVFNDTGADIASLNAAPAALASEIRYFAIDGEEYLFVGTSVNSVLRLDYSAGVATKPAGAPYLYGDTLLRSISGLMPVAW